MLTPTRQFKPDEKPWVAEFLAHDNPVSMVAGQTVMVNLRVKNSGTNVWEPGGAMPVCVGYRWINAFGDPQLDVEDRRTALPSNIAPNQEVAFGVWLAAPKTPGVYTLAWDLIASGVTWFADAGGAPLTIPVAVTAAPRDMTGWRAESNVNPARVAHALDGNPQTCWDSGVLQIPGQWFRLNLAAPRMIDGAHFLSPGKGFPAGYLLRVSANGKTWDTLAHVPPDNTHDVVAVFAPQMVQYLQIDLLSTSLSSWMIADILIHAAATWSAHASHNPQDARRAIDNRVGTAWSSGAPQSAGMWFQLDLGRIETISGLRLDAPDNAHPVNFRITIWNASASRWQIAFEKTNNRERVDATFAATQTQFINIQLLASATRAWAITCARVEREMETWLSANQ